MSRSLYVALLHHPVLDRDGRVVTTSITNMDIHDIARSSRTFGVRRFFVVHPIRGLRALSDRIVEHWSGGYGASHNPSRKEALSRVTVTEDLDRVLTTIEQDDGQLPALVATSARQRSATISYPELARRLDEPGPPILLILGTGSGLTEGVFDQCEMVLEPVKGRDGYNHLSVRAAAAIMLDRLCQARNPA